MSTSEYENELAERGEKNNNHKGSKQARRRKKIRRNKKKRITDKQIKERQPIAG